MSHHHWHGGRFDERDVETGAMVEPLRHRQTKGAATDMFYLTPPRHISTLPKNGPDGPETPLPVYPEQRTSSDRPVWFVSRHKRKSIGADVDLYARPVDGRRTRAISQSGIAHNAVCRINRRSAWHPKLEILS